MPSEALFLTQLVESVTSASWRHGASTSSSVPWYQSIPMIARKKKNCDLSVISRLLPENPYWALTQPWRQISWRSPRKFIFFIFLYNANSLVLLPTQFYIFLGIIEGNYRNHDIHLVFLQNLGTSWSPACPLNSPIYDVYMFNSVSSAIFWSCKMKTQFSF